MYWSRVITSCSGVSAGSGISGMIGGQKTFGIGAVPPYSSVSWLLWTIACSSGGPTSDEKNYFLTASASMNVCKKRIAIV